jgi:hypothetical protein
MTGSSRYKPPRKDKDLAARLPSPKDLALIENPMEDGMHRSEANNESSLKL